jgi:hypothetical protein
MMSLFRFLHSGTPTSGATPPLGPTSASQPGTPTLPLSRTLSGPASMFGHSPSFGGAYPQVKLQRAHSLESDAFRLPESHVGASPTQQYRSFTVQSGFPAAEAQRKHSNSFLELLCKQDSFMGND